MEDMGAVVYEHLLRVQHYRLYPEIVDAAVIDAARVEARLRETVPTRSAGTDNADLLRGTGPGGRRPALENTGLNSSV